MTTWLHEQRMDAVHAAISACGAESVLDIGCGDGPLLIRLISDPRIRRIVGIDLSAEALRRLRVLLSEVPEHIRRKAELVHRSMDALGSELSGFDAAVLVETIEHIDPDHLTRVERAVFQKVRPTTVVITTPNADFNPLLGVPPHRFRHPDHRFEWGRLKFRSWAEGIGRRNGYAVSLEDLAGSHPVLGGASQMALFSITCSSPDDG